MLQECFCVLELSDESRTIVLCIHQLLDVKINCLISILMNLRYISRKRNLHFYEIVSKDGCEIIVILTGALLLKQDLLTQFTVKITGKQCNSFFTTNTIN